MKEIRKKLASWLLRGTGYSIHKNPPKGIKRKKVEKQIPIQ